MILAYDDASHTYTLDGKPCPGVTTILKASGRVFSGNYKPEHAAAGTAVHRATEEMDLLGMSHEDYPETEQGKPFRKYLQAWQSFKEESGAAIIAVERLTWSGEHYYAGTMDRIILWNGPALVDIKRGSKAAWHRLQLAAYIAAENERRMADDLDLESIQKGADIYLKPTGRYSVQILQGFELEDAIQEWLEIVKNYHERKEQSESLRTNQ
jgi:CRISPR/Cas system-associated exonuclease Cas4 (RecB family)